MRGATLRVSGKRRARATAAARQNAILRGSAALSLGRRRRVAGHAPDDDLRRRGARHRHLEVKSRRPQIACAPHQLSIQVDQPAGRVRTAAALRDPHPFVPRHPLGEVPRERGAIPATRILRAPGAVVEYQPKPGSGANAASTAEISPRASAARNLLATDSASAPSHPPSPSTPSLCSVEAESEAAANSTMTTAATDTATSARALTRLLHRDSTRAFPPFVKWQVRR